MIVAAIINRHQLKKVVVGNRRYSRATAGICSFILHYSHSIFDQNTNNPIIPRLLLPNPAEGRRIFYPGAYMREKVLTI